MPELGSYPIATPLSTDLVPFTTGGVVKNVQAQSLVKELYITVGPAGSNSDYICDGVQDDITIQSAINSLPNGGGGTIFVRGGTYSFGGSNSLVFNGRKVRLLGEGWGNTVFTLSSGFSAGAMLNDNSATQGYIEIAGITWNMSGKANVGGVFIYQADNVNVHHCEFTGETSPVISHWGIRLGNYSDTQDLSSRNVRFCNNYIHDMSCGTNEQLLFVGQHDGFVQNNLWRNNTNSNAYEIMLYIDNQNVDVSGNIFESPSANSIGLGASQNNNIHHNQFNHDASFNCITNIQSSGTRVEGNIGKCTAAGNAATFLNIFDRAAGLDGHNNIVPNSNDVTLAGNDVDGFKNGISAQLAGTVLGTAYVMAWVDLSIINNNFRNMGTGGVLRLGVSDVTNTMNDVVIRGNNIWSWSCTGTNGAIFLTGYTSNVASMNNIYIYNNFVAPSSGGGSVPAIRAVACTVVDVGFNSFGGTGGSSTASSAVISNSVDNLGIER